MQYTESIPVASLCPYIKCIWTLEAGIDEAPQVFERIFPDGHPELILHFGTPFEKKQGDSVHVQPAFFVYGQITRYIELRPSADASVLGVRFEPFGLSRFSQLPQFEIMDQEAAIERIFPAHTGLYNTLRPMEMVERKNHLQDCFLSMLNKPINGTRKEGIDTVQQAVQLMRDADGSIPSVNLAKQLHISSRELERRFREYVGLSPKQLAKTFRFQEVLQKKFIESTLTAIAHASGYYDQSHFTRDFRTFSGLPPGDFFRQESGLTDFFISAAK